MHRLVTQAISILASVLLWKRGMQSVLQCVPERAQQHHDAHYVRADAAGRCRHQLRHAHTLSPEEAVRGYL